MLALPWPIRYLDRMDLCSSQACPSPGVAEGAISSQNVPVSTGTWPGKIVWVWDFQMVRGAGLIVGHAGSNVKGLPRIGPEARSTRFYGLRSTWEVVLRGLGRPIEVSAASRLN